MLLTRNMVDMTVLRDSLASSGTTIWCLLRLYLYTFFE